MRSLIRVQAAGAVLCLASAVGTAHADTTQECIAAAYDGQRLRDEGKLMASRAALQSCAASTCPVVVARDCGQWLVDVDSRIPTALFAARDADGRDLVDAAVAIDGKALSSALDGHPVALEAGRHTVRFEAKHHAPVEVVLVTREGEKGRLVSATMHAYGQPAAVAPEATRPPLWQPFVVGGVGIAALGIFGALGAMGQSEKDHLSDTCGRVRMCAQRDVDAAKTKLLVADVALGTGAIALAVATVLFVHRASVSARAPRQEAPSSTSR